MTAIKRSSTILTAGGEVLTPGHPATKMIFWIKMNTKMMGEEK